MDAERGQPTVIRKEMGITHKDFYAELPNLLGDIPYQQSEDITRFELNGKKVEIILGPEGVRELGHSVRLPVTAVVLHLFDFSEEEVRDFVGHFNLKFMRGGG